MLAFEVYVNKVKVCTAGLDELALVNAQLFSLVKMDGNPDERKLPFHVSGMKDKRMYQWFHHWMKKGNRVEIRIVEANETDEPKEMKCGGGSCEV